ncbi:MAG TPA: serine hydrolase domain-containing protein [Longimicrobiaceae bacterium]|nr:serine hydrolase domain-containing protein [Longimicrobiaceae bacterium]
MSDTFRCIVAALLAATPSLLAAQQKPVSGPQPSAAALTVLVDSVVRASLLTRGVPGVSVAVVRGDETLVQRAWGRADAASGRAADPSTLYAIGSNSKQFTAALVLRLVERGRLTLGDSIGRHLSGLRPEWRAITIEQLLNHTSGLQRSFVDKSRMEADLPGDSLIAQAARDTVAARPGTTFLYSNTGYLVLGVLVEKLYGKPYADALRDEIARPLGLTTLRSCGDAEAPPGATGHLRSPDGTLSSPFPLHPSQSLGASGICTTAADLAKWNRALHGGRVLSAASYRAMTTPRGAAIPASYGFGLSVAPAPWGGPAMTHGGQDVTGFTSEHGWYPADSLSVTILYNAFPRVAAGGTHIIAALALGRTPPAMRNAAPEPAVATAPATGIVGEEARRQFVGEYELGPGAVFRVDFEEGAFVLTPPGGGKSAMVHESGATYAVGSAGSGTTITFLADAEGRVVGFLARAAGSPDRRLRKVR